MSSEEASYAVLAVDVSHGGHDTEPGAGVSGELWVRSLEEDFDSIERADDCFSLLQSLSALLLSSPILRSTNSGKCGCDRASIQRILPFPRPAHFSRYNLDSACPSSSGSQPLWVLSYHHR